jgi:hypothetical protein
VRRIGRDFGRQAAAGVIGLGVAGCGAIARDRDKGHIEVTWSGAEKGTMSAPAGADWCPAARTVQLTAVQGDTGLGILIYPPESLVVGKYPVVEPADARTKSPTASVGFRLMNQTAVSGYQGQTGVLIIERVQAAQISGHFDATGRTATAAVGNIHLTGRFVNVPLTSGRSACGR